MTKIPSETNFNKKILSAVMASLLAAGCLTGCGSQKRTVILPDKPEEASIYVEPIDGLSEDFIKGMDISSILAEEESGVVYYNANGEEQDLFEILADSGINYIRVRVWNHPYDGNGNGYGGGNNDVAKAAEIGKRAAQNNMKLLVDFHYSDFWADPTKQFAPKEWVHMSFEEKQQALYDFTLESLNTISKSGADIGMVQIGNEINNGMAGETDEARVIELLKQGSAAVRAFAKQENADIAVAAHYTNVEDNNQIMAHAKALQDAGLDYDVFGVSYYSFWHGTMENLTEVLSQIRETYGKKTCVLETSYAYTPDDGDGSGNSISETDLIKGYAATVQSQAANVRDVMAAANNAGSMGVFYWEGAWVPVGRAENVTENAKLWEQYGSGWASSYAAEYDPEDAGKYYGGSSWDNQAFFDFEGKKLPSLDVFKYVNYGTICEPAIDYLEESEVKLNIGEPLTMPESVYAVYNDRSKSGEAAVTWDDAQTASINTNTAGEYIIDGTLADGRKVSTTVKVANINYVENPSFEEKDMSMWQVIYDGANPTDVQTKESDAMTGTNSFHFWDSIPFDFTLGQTISGLTAGSYTLTANIQGCDVGADAVIYLYATVGDTTFQSEPVALAGWCNWQVPEITDIPLDGNSDITIGLYVSSAAGGWGTVDDFYLYKQ